MATNKNLPNTVDAFEIALPFPKEVPGFEEDEHGKYGALLITIDKKAVTIFERAYDALMQARAIPYDIRNVDFSDPVVVHIFRETKSNDPISLAQRHYEKLQTEARQQALILGICYKNNFIIPPIPEEEENFEEENYPDWFVEAEQGFQLPEPVKDYKNPYEKRLRQFDLTIEAAGPAFQQELTTVSQKAIRKLLELMGGSDTDEDGFQSRTASKQIHDGNGSEDGSEGKTPRKRSTS